MATRVSRYPPALSRRRHTRAPESARNPLWLNLRAKQMVDDPAATPSAPRRKGGRPSRAEASRKALLGVDLTVCDPVAILREIALDRSMPGSTRVQACRTLLGLPEGSEARTVADDPVAERAIQIMAAARRGH